MSTIKPVGGKVQLEVDRLDEGLNTTAGPNRVDLHGSPDCLNVVFDNFGSVATRNGCSLFNTNTIGTAPVDGLANYNQTMLAWVGGNMYRASGTTFATVQSAQSQFQSGANIAWVVYQQVLFCSDGSNAYRYEGEGTAGAGAFYRMGIAVPSAPTAASNVATVAGGGPEPGTYYYKVSYLNTHVVEGQAGSASVGAVIVNTAVVNVTSIPTGAASLGVAQRFIYRASATGGPYRFVGSLANNTASTFTDTMGATTWAVGAQTITDGTAPTPFTTIKLHKDRLFLDDSSDRTILRYTNFRNPYISEAANFINLDKGDGANITAIGVQDDLVAVFKKNSIWVVALNSPGDDLTWESFKTPGNVGIVGPKALVEIQNAIFFIGMRNNKISGFHILSGLTLTDSQDTRLRSDSISNRIQRDVLRFASSLWSDVALSTYNNVIYAAVAKENQTQNKHIYWLDANRLSQPSDSNSIQEIGSWSLWDGKAAQVKNFVTVNGLLYAGSSNSDGQVLRLEVPSQFSDAGSVINSYWWSKLLGGEDSIESWVKDFRYLTIWFATLGAWNMRVSWRVDGDTSDGYSTDIDMSPGGSLWGTMVWGTGLWGGGTTDVELQKSFGELLGRKIQVKFSNNSVLNAGFKVHNFKILMNLRRILRVPV